MDFSLWKKQNDDSSAASPKRLKTAGGRVPWSGRNFRRTGAGYGREVLTEASQLVDVGVCVYEDSIDIN